MSYLPLIEVEELDIEEITINAPVEMLSEVIRQAIADHKAKLNLADRVNAARSLKGDL